MDQPKNFLERLQNSDEAVKQRWLVGSAAVIMAIVVFLWLAYFNSFVIGPRNMTPVAPGAAADGESISFFGTMKNGVSVIYRSALGKLRGLGDILAQPREYIIRPPSEN